MNIKDINIINNKIKKKTRNVYINFLGTHLYIKSLQISLGTISGVHLQLVVDGDSGSQFQSFLPEFRWLFSYRPVW